MIISPLKQPYFSLITLIKMKKLSPSSSSSSSSSSSYLLPQTTLLLINHPRNMKKHSPLSSSSSPSSSSSYHLPQTLTLILIITILSLISTTATAASNTTAAAASANTTYIKQCCSTTTYPSLCYATLASYAAEIRTSPKLLSTKSLSVALAAAQSASRAVARLSRLPRARLRPAEAGALSECEVAVAHSEIQLSRSLQEMMATASGGGVRGNEDNEEMVVSDVMTWTSAALTYEEACMEEFEGREMKGNVRVIVRKEVWKLQQLTSNALALVHHVLAKEIANKKQHHR